MTDLRLDLDALVGPVAPGDDVWAMVLRRRRRPGSLLRLPWLARWRRFRRRRAGWRPERLSLRVAGGRVDLLLRGDRLSSRPFPSEPKELP